VDLRGEWTLPSNEVGSNPLQNLLIKAIVQCKNEQAVVGPKYIRELEGTLLREDKGTIGLLSASEGFTAAAHKQFDTSSLPMILLKVPDDVERQLEMAIWLNLKTRQAWPGLVVSSIYEQRHDEDGLEKRVALFYRGRRCDDREHTRTTPGI
jgi:hypothetical protein